MDESTSRRRFLAAVAAGAVTGTSGCGSDGSSTPTAADVDETLTAKPTEEPTPTATPEDDATSTATPLDEGTSTATPGDGATPTATPDPEDLADWPSFMYNGRNWGHHPEATGPHGDVSVVWERNLASNQVNGTPTLANGQLYVGDGRINTDSGTFYALNPLTGETNWTVDLPGPVMSGATVAEGRVYAGAKGTLVAHNEDGSEVYRFRSRSDGRISSPTFGDGSVFFGIEDLVYRYESLRNVQEWTFDTFGRISGAPVLADGTVYAGSHDGSVYARDASNGNEEWETDLGDRVNGLSLRNGRLYAATEGNRLVQLNTQGKEVWSVSTGAAATATPAVTEEFVHVGTRGGDLLTLAVGDGFEEWRYTEPTDEVTSPPVVADGTVYFGSNDSNVYAVEAQSGEPEWSFGTGNNIVNPAPVVSGGMVFIGSRDGTFYALSD
ncbi:hypothetical protein BRC70_07765 [Halobacteriales archaeon QH_6_68_27]|nr:MAG: hypothetical protein BRC70_07765 [Halobacteriales archaeon QH_6_68_27]